MDARFGLLAVLLALLTGCASVQKAALNIERGDTKERVQSVMGAPEDRQFKDQMEAWQYSNVVSIGVCEYTVIWFKSLVVTGITTYRNSSVAGCRVGTRSIRWEEAPDATIEIRQR